MPTAETHSHSTTRESSAYPGSNPGGAYFFCGFCVPRGPSNGGSVVVEVVMKVYVF